MKGYEKRGRRINVVFKKLTYLSPFLLKVIPRSHCF